MASTLARLGFLLFAVVYWRKRTPSWFPTLSRRRVQILASVLVGGTIAVDAVALGLDHAAFYATAVIIGYVYAGIMGARRDV